jgi:cysteinyl-tRNA synthetase
MSVKFLGEQFDIHTGGVDHIPIHHTNEVAQSECATGKSPFVRYWMHGEFLVIDDAEKMSKSLGNVLTVTTLEEKGFDPLAYRLLLLQSHYRKQLRFSTETLAGAARGLARLAQTAQRLVNQAPFSGKLPKPGEALESDKARGYRAQFYEAMGEDLNTPQALAAMFTMLDDAAVSPADKLRLLVEQDLVFGLAPWEERKTQDDVPAELTELLAQRNRARAAKDFAEADRLRKEIAARGYEILDSAGGSSLRRRL